MCGAPREPGHKRGEEARRSRVLPAGVRRVGRAWLLDDVGSGQDRLRDRQAQRFGGLQIDDQLELRRLFDRNIGRIRGR